MYNTFAILDNMIYHCWAWVNSESLRMTGTCPCVIQSREVGIKAYYSIIAPESFASAARSAVDPSYSHDHFWTETWANYLSKGYFGTSWIGPESGYPAVNISWINRFRINVARYLP